MTQEEFEQRLADFEKRLKFLENKNEGLSHEIDQLSAFIASTAHNQGVSLVRLQRQIERLNGDEVDHK